MNEKENELKIIRKKLKHGDFKLIANKLALSYSTIKKVLHGSFNNDRVLAVAKALGNKREKELNQVLGSI